MNIGFIGLGKMGGEMAVRVNAAGHKIIGYDSSPIALNRAVERGVTVVNTIQELAKTLVSPKIVWIMTPPGAPTETAITDLMEILATGDIVIDGGNSDFRDTLRRAGELKKKGITLVDVGVSGGVQGARDGCGLLVGSDPDVFDRLKPIFHALAAPGGYALVGSSGAGHFAKAVHNGVEYAMMQAYGEGYELLTASDIQIDVLAAFQAWQRGCSIRSYLLEEMIQALKSDPNLNEICGYVADSGMGRWTVEESIRLRVPVPTISAALQARFRSQQDDSPTMKSIAALRGVIGGHPVKKTGGDRK
jgi:6-phosphogluconate dehydrogenase